MSRRCNLSDCACCASGADAISAPAADAVKGLVPGMLENFALPFRHRQRAQPLRPPAGAQLESRWDQPAALGGPVPRRLQDVALTFRHRQQTLQPLRLPVGASVEPRWNQPAISRGRYLGCCVFGAPGVDAVYASAADAVRGLVRGMHQNFPLWFRHRQRAAQLVRPPARRQVEPQWDQAAAVAGARLSTRLRGQQSQRVK
jgi:hypothetical protein